MRSCCFTRFIINESLTENKWFALVLKIPCKPICQRIGVVIHGWMYTLYFRLHNQKLKAAFHYVKRSSIVTFLKHTLQALS